MPKNKFDIDKIQVAIRKFADERDWGQFHTPKNLAMALAGEVGELLEIFQWLSEEEAKKIMKSPKASVAVRNEVADILYYLLRLTDVLKIDLDSAFWEKFELNSQKYPVKLSKGNSKKYTDL